MKTVSNVTRKSNQTIVTSNQPTIIKYRTTEREKHPFKIEMHIFDYEIRLTQESRDFLEIHVNSTWYRVCDIQFGVIEANIVCIQLGFSLVTVERYTNNKILPTEFFKINTVNCLDNETQLIECSHLSWSISSNCSSGQSISLVCNDTGNVVRTCDANQWLCTNSAKCVDLTYLCDGVYDCTDSSDEDASRCELSVQYRLSANWSTTDAIEGYAEVRNKGVWGTVCNDGIGESEAKVFCRSIGYHGKAVSLTIVITSNIIVYFGFIYYWEECLFASKIG